jgi:hypothetical protein
MSRQEFRYWPEPYDPAADLKRFPYVVDDVVWAKAHGYGRDIEQGLDKAAAENPNQAYFRGLPVARQIKALIALHGTTSGSWLEAKSPAGGTLQHSDNGCTVEAWRRLYGDVETWYQASRVVSDLDGTQVAQVLDDPRFQARVVLWRTCMKDRGYDVDNPGQLRAETLAYQHDDARDRDRRAAVNEAECARSSGLSQTARALDSSYAARLRNRYAVDYETSERLKDAALSAATDIARRY